MTDRDILIGQALAEVSEGRSIRAVSRDYDIPRSTLLGRLQGAQTRQIKAGMARKLTAVQEEAVVGWVLGEEAAGRSPSHQSIQEFASLVLGGGDPTVSVGKNWSARFMQRHEGLKMKP